MQASPEDGAPQAEREGRPQRARRTSVRLLSPSGVGAAVVVGTAPRGHPYLTRGAGLGGRALRDTPTRGGPPRSTVAVEEEETEWHPSQLRAPRAVGHARLLGQSRQRQAVLREHRGAGVRSDKEQSPWSDGESHLLGAMRRGLRRWSRALRALPRTCCVHGGACPQTRRKRARCLLRQSKTCARCHLQCRQWTQSRTCCLRGVRTRRLQALFQFGCARGWRRGLPVGRMRAGKKGLAVGRPGRLLAPPPSKKRAFHVDLRGRGSPLLSFLCRAEASSRWVHQHQWWILRPCKPRRSRLAASRPTEGGKGEQGRRKS